MQNYQISFIEKRFNHDEVEAAYREMSCEFDDLYQAGRSKKIMALDCGFGDYAKVFRSILGESRYRVLRDECWKLKQIATVRERYGVDNVLINRPLIGLSMRLLLSVGGRKNSHVG